MKQNLKKGNGVKVSIENFYEEQGRKIANAIMLKHDEYPSLLRGNQIPKGFLNDMKKGYKEYSEVNKMEKEIWDRSLREATAFFLQNPDLKLDEEVRNILIKHLSQKSKKSSALKNFSSEQLLASEIQNFTTDFLLENNIFVFENNV